MTATVPNIDSEPDELKVLRPGQTIESVTDQISDVVLKRPLTRQWIVAFGIVFLLVLVLTSSIGYLIAIGVGVWGVNIPVAWGFAITNFVWWIGIGHAGTFISAMLLLMRQEWRTSINRFAEAMTLFAVACAGLFPLLHLGRPWKFYFLFPYANTMNLWPQFRSPLVWDVFAVSTYGTISLVFWYVGLVPDLATMRDRAKKKYVRVIYGAMALGWRGAAKHWHNYAMAYLLLGALAAPLVVSVHSVVGMDFSGGLVPGWHNTIFPPYFVAGAIFSGFAMVVTLAIPLRAIYRLDSFITIRHIDNCAKLMLITGLIVAYGYSSEVFMAWYSGEPYETFLTFNHAFGPLAWSYWTIITCNVIVPQFFWFKRVRQNVAIMWVLALLVQVGMWTERFVIVVTSLHRDYMPTAWGMYHPTVWDLAALLGTMGLFLCFFFLFVRLLPVIAMFEMRELVEKKATGDTNPSSTEPAHE